MVVFPGDGKELGTFLPVVFLDAVGEKFSRFRGPSVILETNDQGPRHTPSTAGTAAASPWRPWTRRHGPRAAKTGAEIGASDKGYAGGGMSYRYSKVQPSAMALGRFCSVLYVQLGIKYADPDVVYFTMYSLRFKI
jgi:hypothetical protein